MSRFIETIRFSGGKLQNLARHMTRVHAALQGTPSWDAEHLLSAVTIPGNGVYKVRIVYDQNTASITTEPYTIRPVRSLKLVFNDSIVYDHKYEDRKEIEDMFAQRGTCEDVLIIKNNSVTDTSYSNIIFKREDKWVTPDTYLLNGVMRKTLLSDNKITAIKITPSDIYSFSHFKLINAMLCEDAAESEVSNIH